MVPICYQGPIGGAQYSIRVPFSYPTIENQTVKGIAYGDVGACGIYSISMSVILCPGGFYIYNASNHPYTNMGYVTCKEQLLIVTICFILICPVQWYAAFKETYFYLNTMNIIYVFVSLCVCYLCLDHYVCSSGSCGPLAECTAAGGCDCVTGYQMPKDQLPTPDSYGCNGKRILLHLNCCKSQCD